MFLLVSTHSAYMFRSASIDMICMKIEVPGKIGVFLHLWQWPAISLSCCLNIHGLEWKKNRALPSYCYLVSY